jgi:hypothetical protein
MLPGAAAAVDVLGLGRVGVYTSLPMWADVMGNSTDFNDLALWWAVYDNEPSFDGWKSFGGWNQPRLKQFNDGSEVCGVSMDHNWAPL